MSVLIPARNEESNIERCVTSLLAQDYPDFELLVRSSTVPPCPRCGSTTLDKAVSLVAPAQKIPDAPRTFSGKEDEDPVP